MNNFQIFFIVVYAISLLVGMYQLSLGSKPVKFKTNREEGIAKVVGVFVGLPLFLAATGVI